jgi:putative FmdB family regulatory protein
MPTYEYRCDNGHLFEVMLRMSDDPLTSCEVCGAPVQRVFSPVAVHFKGTGFYSTDYGSKNRARELKESGEGAGKQAKDGGSDGSSSDGAGTKKPDPAPAKAASQASSAD